MAGNNEVNGPLERRVTVKRSDPRGLHVNTNVRKHSFCNCSQCKMYPRPQMTYLESVLYIVMTLKVTLLAKRAVQTRSARYSHGCISYSFTTSANNDF